jgi:hypothetical protein
MTDVTTDKHPPNDIVLSCHVIEDRLSADISQNHTSQVFSKAHSDITQACRLASEKYARMKGFCINWTICAG